MAVESMGASGLKYKAFFQGVNEESFAREQKGPMRLRLQLLESFMETGMNAFKRTKSAYDIFDPASACVLFDICIALFLEGRRAVGRVVALDEAHKVGWSCLTGNLLVIDINSSCTKAPPPKCSLRVFSPLFVNSDTKA